MGEDAVAVGPEVGFVEEVPPEELRVKRGVGLSEADAGPQYLSEKRPVRGPEIYEVHGPPRRTGEVPDERNLLVGRERARGHHADVEVALCPGRPLGDEPYRIASPTAG